jgi:hypothetical protein
VACRTEDYVRTRKRRSVSLECLCHAFLHLLHIKKPLTYLSRIGPSHYNSGNSGQSIMPRLISYRDLMRCICYLDPNDVTCDTISLSRDVCRKLLELLPQSNSLWRLNLIIYTIRKVAGSIPEEVTGFFT